MTYKDNQFRHNRTKIKIDNKYKSNDSSLAVIVKHKTEPNTHAIKQQLTYI